MVGVTLATGKHEGGTLEGSCAARRTEHVVGEASSVERNSENEMFNQSCAVKTIQVGFFCGSCVPFERLGSWTWDLSAVLERLGGDCTVYV